MFLVSCPLLGVVLPDLDWCGGGVDDPDVVVSVVPESDLGWWSGRGLPPPEPPRSPLVPPKPLGVVLPPSTERGLPGSPDLIFFSVVDASRNLSPSFARSGPSFPMASISLVVRSVIFNAVFDTALTT